MPSELTNLPNIAKVFHRNYIVSETGIPLINFTLYSEKF